MHTGWDILMENAKTFKERGEIQSLTESEQRAVSATLVTNLFNSVTEKGHVNFEDIPVSKGDLTRYSGYNTMLSTLELLKQIAAQNNTTIDAIPVIEKAIQNIVLSRTDFERGFALHKEFIELTYNTLVYSVVESISLLITAYVDFMKQIDKTEFIINPSATNGLSFTVANLRRFNDAYKAGTFQKTIRGVIETGKENFVGVSTVAASVMIGALVIVPITRELIFSIYYSRMKVSEYLDQQAALLEFNRLGVESSGMDARDKKAVLKKQEESRKKILQLSDRIKVDGASTQRKVNDSLKKENREWTIDSVRNQTTSDTMGFSML